MRTRLASHARGGGSAKELGAGVNQKIFEDLEAKVIALRALQARLRDGASGDSFGDLVARWRSQG